MKLPQKIKIGYADIDIVPMKSLEGFSHGCYGHFSESELCIRIITDLKPLVVMNTLIHEVMHACFFMGGLSDDDDEERTVNTMSNQYCQVLRDNPEYNKFVQTCLRGQ
jgi:hypothetical protein